MSATEARQAYATTRDRFQRIFSIDISTNATLKSFANALKHRVDSQSYLNSFFAERARTVRLDILQYCRDADSFKNAMDALDRLMTFYDDPARWVMRHGNYNGWEEYRVSIDVVSEGEAEYLRAGLWRFATSNLMNLKKLWEDVREAERMHIQAQQISDTGMPVPLSA